MQMPVGYTEQDVIAIMEKCVNVFVKKYKKQIRDKDDLKQQGRLFGLEALHKFDATKGSLDGFLYTHIRNKLLDFIRNSNTRKNSPNKASQLDMDVKDEDSFLNDISYYDLSSYIKENIPLCFRADYLRMMDNAPLSNSKKKKVREVVLELLKERLCPITLKEAL
jgi:DNA-directed RNA polymerase specialized sigma24 family protein